MNAFRPNTKLEHTGCYRNTNQLDYDFIEKSMNLG